MAIVHGETSAPGTCKPNYLCPTPPPSPAHQYKFQCMNSNDACHPLRIASTRHLILYHRPWANTGNICDTSCLQSSKANRLNAKTFRLFPHIRTTYIVCLRILLLQRYSESRRPGVLPVGTIPRGRSSWRLHSWLMGVSGIVPGKIMERPGTVRPPALWIALLTLIELCCIQGSICCCSWQVYNNLADIWPNAFANASCKFVFCRKYDPIWNWLAWHQNEVGRREIEQ